jgi:hypothetical protein
VELSVHVTTICPSDQVLMHAEFGCDSTLVPNGTTVCDVSLPALDLSGCEPYFSFAGSSYWPNVEGFASIATPSLAFLPPTIKIDVAGTVGPELLKSPSILRHQSANASRIRVRGFLSMDEMVAMMHRSRSVLVPVFIGEGSNLKSADGEGVTVVESATAFRAAMRRAIRSTELNRRRPASLAALME